MYIAVVDKELLLEKDGNVGIGTTAPTNILTVVQHSPTDPIADAWTVYSKPDSKIILGPADHLAFDYLEKFRNLSVYQWKRSEGEPVRLGVIAQEGVPEEILAFDAEGNIQGIDLGGYIGFLHEVMIAQQSQIDELKLAINNQGQVLIDGQEPDLQFSVESNSLIQALSQLTGKIITAGEWVFDRITAKTARIERLEEVERLQMIDKATGEIYCTWIENGEWKKVQGECD